MLVRLGPARRTADSAHGRAARSTVGAGSAGSGARPRGDGPSRGARGRKQRAQSPERSQQRTRGLLPL